LDLGGEWLLSESKLVRDAPLTGWLAAQFTGYSADPPADGFSPTCESERASWAWPVECFLQCIDLEANMKHERAKEFAFGLPNWLIAEEFFCHLNFREPIAPALARTDERRRKFL
jgi:hypothetical protein